ncbi:MAG: hypothetical protein KGL39_02635 [Patescibacteria group bacterium]|nr:hypothetical protein [Patescibacteria group bacterium]
MKIETESPLQPLIDLALKKRGVKSAVQRRVIELGGVATNAQIFDWLNPDESYRRLPRGDTLKLLLKIQTEMVK